MIIENLAAPRRTQEERRAESERRLIEAALDLVAEQGFAGTTAAEIAARAGYSRSLVAERFGSKVGLAHALVEHLRVVFEEEWQDTSGEVPDRGVVLSFYDAYIDGLAAGDCRYRAVLLLLAESVTELPEVRGALADFTASVRDDLRTRTERAQVRGEIPAWVDAAGLAVVTLSVLRGIALQWSVDPVGVDLPGAAATGRRMIETYLDAGTPPD